jgi:hypothetical protein
LLFPRKLSVIDEVVFLVVLLDLLATLTWLLAVS